jgi:hypothetical protein
MSTTFSTHSIAAALVKAEDFLGSNREWITVNPKQEGFITRYFTSASRTDIESLREVIATEASWEDVDPVNRFLKSRGFDIQLNQIGPDEFAVAAILDMMVEWLEEGEYESISSASTGQRYPGVCLGAGVDFFRSAGTTDLVVRLQTKGGDYVYLVMAPPTEEVELIVHAQNILATLTPDDEYQKVAFPQVNLSQEVDISWFQGMSTQMDSGRRAKVTQALMQNKLTMNTTGARAQSAVAMSIVLECCMVDDRKMFTINRPFMVIFTRNGISAPVFVAHVTEGDWKSPDQSSSQDESAPQDEDEELRNLMLND